MHISCKVGNAKFVLVVGIYARLRSLRRNRDVNPEMWRTAKSFRRYLLPLCGNISISRILLQKSAEKEKWRERKRPKEKIILCEVLILHSDRYWCRYCTYLSFWDILIQKSMGHIHASETKRKRATTRKDKYYAIKLLKNSHFIH